MLLRKAFFLAQMHRRQWWPTERLATVQQCALSDIVQHAYDAVPYYRRRFDEAGIGRPAITKPADLLQVPVTRKQDLAPLPMSDRLADGVDRDRIIVFTSSGSTGEPFEIPTTSELSDLRGSSIIRALLANGILPWRPIALLATPPELADKPDPLFSLYRRIQAPVTEPVDEQIAFLRALRPSVIEGYPSYIAEVAQALTAGNIRDIRPSAIVTNSETLADSTRTIIRNGFGVDPVNMYDCWEFGSIAWQCPHHGGLHVNTDLLHVEILLANGTPAPPGTTGEVVVTDLHNRVAPLIRYGMNDLGTFARDACPCGRGFPLLERVGGRTNVNFVHADGRRMPAAALLDTTMQLFPVVTTFQCIQYVPGELEVRMVSPEPLTTSQKEEVACEVRKRLHIQTVSVKQTNTVTRGPNGKAQPFVSLISGSL